MQVLIVDGFGASSEERERYALFRRTIRNSVTSRSFDGDVTFFERKHGALECFLYERETQFTDERSLKRFHTLDMIFVDGRDAALPWAPEYYQVFSLVRMAFKSNKSLFLAGPFSMFLAYFCFTGGREIRVVNGNGEGSDLSTIHNYGFQRMDRKGVFLDNSTGDLYDYDSARASWIPSCSCGLINCATLRRFHNTRQCLTRSNFSNLNFPTSLWDTECRVLKEKGGHYLVSALPALFKVSVHSNWMILNKPPLLPYNVLAVDHRTPLIFEYQRFLGVQFHLSRCHPESFIVLQEFVWHSMSQFRTERTSSVPFNPLLKCPTVQYHNALRLKSKSFTSRSTPVLLDPGKKQTNLFAMSLHQQPLRVLPLGGTILGAFRGGSSESLQVVPRAGGTPGGGSDPWEGSSSATPSPPSSPAPASLPLPRLRLHLDRTPFCNWKKHSRGRPANCDSLRGRESFPNL